MTATERGRYQRRNSRTSGASTKLSSKASAIGTKTSRAKYKVPTTITPTSTVVSVEPGGENPILEREIFSIVQTFTHLKRRRPELLAAISECTSRRNEDVLLLPSA